MVSKALLKSIKMFRQKILSFKDSYTNSVNLINASDVDLPGRKPNCDGEITENLFKNASMRLKMDLSNILLRKCKTDIGR